MPQTCVLKGRSRDTRPEGGVMVRTLVAILLLASPLAAQAEAPEEALSSCLADSSMSMQPF